jgi:RND superfamily putative drug exporter
LLKTKFAGQQDNTAGSAIIVVYDANGLSPQDYQDAQTFHGWLVSPDGPAGISSVVSIYENDALRQTLVSQDGTTMLMELNFTNGALSPEAEAATTATRDYLKNNFPDLKAYFTGQAGLIQDMFNSVSKTIDRATFVTVALVAVLLLLIYRSPVAIILPLAAIGASFGVSAGVIGWLGSWGVQFSTLAEAYMVVVVFGVGTDYCLFIVSRFREELRGSSPVEAQKSSIRHIAPVIAASAITVIVAFLSLTISQFGMNRSMGYALAVAVTITLLAGLTLVPALISLFGKYLFWPGKIMPAHKEGRLWVNIGSWVSKHPLLVMVPIIVVLAVPYLGLLNLNRSADIVDELPQSSDSVIGYRTMVDHFPAGELYPGYLMLESTEDLRQGSLAADVGSLADTLAKVEGVERVQYFGTPATDLTAAAGQLSTLSQAVKAGQGLQQLSRLSDMGTLLESLVFRYPAIMQSPNFQAAGAQLTQLTTLAGQVAGASQADLPALLGPLSDALAAGASDLNGLAAEFNLQTSTPFTAALLGEYFSTDGHIARINVIYAGDPNSAAAFDTVKRLRVAAAQDAGASGLTGSTTYLGGEVASRADILLVNDADFGKVVSLSVAGILIVIILLLRSVLAPLYMVLTVLFNYGATLGLSAWLFLGVLKHSALDYALPLFIFVVLAALGADYNIFLVSRIREEAHKSPPETAVKDAVTHTGNVITACGIILAGTFATLMTSPLDVVFQIGGAIALGVIMDTFLVRALLVPAIARMAGRWSWWPSKLFREAER